MPIFVSLKSGIIKYSNSAQILDCYLSLDSVAIHLAIVSIPPAGVIDSMQVITLRLRMSLTTLRSAAFGLVIVLVLIRTAPASGAASISGSWDKTDSAACRTSIAIRVNESAAAKQKTYGNCQCNGGTFGQRFERAYTVVKARVIAEWTSCKYCRAWNGNQYRIHVYVIQIQYQMKGPKMRRVPRVQGFSFSDLCGRRLRNGESYLLMLPDPRQTSTDSFWFRPKMWPHVSQCEMDRFTDLTISQIKYLVAKRRRWLRCKGLFA